MKKKYVCSGYLIFTLLILFRFFLSPSNIFAQIETFAISGQVIDSTDSSDLPGVAVRLLGTKYGAYSDKNGNFLIKEVPAGNYKLVCSMIGYAPKNIVIQNLQKNENFNIRLQQQVFRTESIIVTANQRLQNIQEISNSAIVIGKNELNRTSKSDFEQVLKDVPGLEVFDETISIRGSDGFDFGIGSRTLMMLDGLPLMSGDQGDVKFDLIPNSEISRVEIVKGSGSALYGSSAIGGVINLISKDKDDKLNKENNFTYDFSTEMGYYPHPKFKAWVRPDSSVLKLDIEGTIGYKTNKWGITLAGDIDKDPSYRKFDDNERWSVFSKFYLQPSENVKLNLFLLHQENNSADWVYWNSLDSATYPPTNTNLNNRIYSKKSMLGFIMQNPISFLKGFWSTKFGLFYTDFYNNLEKNNTDYRASQTLARYLDFQFTFPIIENSVFTFGTSWFGNLVNSASFGDRKQDIIALYAQAEYKPITNLTFTFGSRFDVEGIGEEAWNNEFSPKFGMNYLLSSNLTIRASVGKGFRAPTVAERFAAISFQGFKVVENMDLKPETSWNFEIGGNVKFTDFIFPMELDGTFFWNTFSDLIEPGFVDELYSTIKFQNIINARIPGIELSLKTAITNNLFFTNSITILDPVDTDLNEVLKFRSKYFANSSILFTNDNFDFKFSYRYSSKVEKIDDKLVLQVKDAQSRVPMHVVDLFAGYKLEYLAPIGGKMEITVGLNVYNLFNYYYTYMVGNLAPTRYIGISISSSY